ncbi:MAG: hypothetical protein AAGI52_07260 [Bacteroidota bacterium]
MDKSEFERIKAEEKAHLRKLRALKNQHRDAKRKASILGALKGMGTSKLDATHDEFTGKLATDAAMTEARFEIASEEAERAAQAERDAEATRQSDAEALIQQMKAELGGDPATPPASAPRRTDTPAAASGKTIGRTPPEAETPESTEPDRGAKSIGRRRG